MLYHVDALRYPATFHSLLFAFASMKRPPTAWPWKDGAARKVASSSIGRGSRGRSSGSTAARCGKARAPLPATKSASRSAGRGRASGRSSSREAAGVEQPNAAKPAKARLLPDFTGYKRDPDHWTCSFSWPNPRRRGQLPEPVMSTMQRLEPWERLSGVFSSWQDLRSDYKAGYLKM